jgi:hypothetical protein
MIRMQGCRVELWPEADRLAWLAANTVSDDPWDTDGDALKLGTKTQGNYARAYGIWLAWLQHTNQLLPNETPGQRVTPERVSAWVRHMLAFERKRSVIKLYLISLHAMVDLIAPGTDTRFIMHPGGRSLHTLFPSTAKPAAPYDTADLIKYPIRLHKAAIAAPPGLQRNKHLRDAAIMAILYSRAPRVSDLTRLRIGKELRLQADGSMLVSWPKSKNTRPLEYTLDDWCAQILADYLAHGRPQLRGANTTDQLWVGTHGDPLNDIGVTGVVKRRNQEFLGYPYGPQMARKWLTDSARKRSPEAALDSAEVLGHSIQTALKHYAQAVDTHAGRRHGENLSRLRQKTAGLAERAFAERDKARKESDD